MRLCGITSLEQATSDLVNTLDLDHLVVTGGESRDRKQFSALLSKL
jgi:L-lactate dehydrogenase (cytochrome)